MEHQNDPNVAFADRAARKRPGRDKRRLNVAVGAAIIAGAIAFCGTATSAVLLSENFSGAVPGGGGSAGGAYSVGPISGTQFGVTSDNVDIIGVVNGSNFTCTYNPAGNCLDLVGNESGGAIASTTTFNLVAGAAYTVSFNAILQGYGPGQGFTSFDVGLGSQTDLESVTGSGQNFSLTFTPLVDETGATLSFTTVTPGDSVHGAVLSDIVLASAVPEPAVWTLMIAGMAGIGATLRRRGQAIIA